MSTDGLPAGIPAGARGNGLPAASWALLREVDSHLTSTVLEALREAGIPAYAVPSSGVLGGYLEVHLPNRPADRIWVDRATRSLAAAVVTGALPPVPDAPPAPADEEARWAELVASFDAPPATPVGVWPASEDIDESRPVEASFAPHPLEPEQPAYLLDDEDHFEPPPPPPLPKLRTRTRYALLAMAAGVLVLVLPAILSESLSGGLLLLGIALILGGAVALLLGMGDSPPSDSGWDDGAVV